MIIIVIGYEECLGRDMCMENSEIIIVIILLIEGNILFWGSLNSFIEE